MHFQFGKILLKMKTALNSVFQTKSPSVIHWFHYSWPRQILWYRGNSILSQLLPLHSFAEQRERDVAIWAYWQIKVDLKRKCGFLMGIHTLQFPPHNSFFLNSWSVFPSELWQPTQWAVQRFWLLLFKKHLHWIPEGKKIKIKINLYVYM